MSECCKPDCCKQEVHVGTQKAGAWLTKGKTDVHLYSVSLCEGGDGALIGFNNEALMSGKIYRTPIALVIQDGKCRVQVVDDDNVLKTYTISPDKVYDLLKDLLVRIKDDVQSNMKPGTVVKLN